ncbi:unnamed protein product [Notodromas monacha]|uniref:CAP-Gly domain-containing protein n=1 Tax=Notodromas monacha TaxID=399045 RepID=A0A7R9GFB4_9CRUS|nr:unnamed protein product [Notodromas monacha]CAG0920622.1 unnamed protein product [Notodromas monacha]
MTKDLMHHAPHGYPYVVGGTPVACYAPQTWSVVQRARFQPYENLEPKQHSVEDQRPVPSNACVIGDVPVPYWLRVYLKASPEHDHKLRWDFFRISELETFEAMMQRIMMEEMDAVIRNYAMYRYFVSDHDLISTTLPVRSYQNIDHSGQCEWFRSDGSKYRPPFYFRAALLDEMSRRRSVMLARQNEARLKQLQTISVPIPRTQPIQFRHEESYNNRARSPLELEMDSGDHVALVDITVTSNLSSAYAERRFPVTITIGELKNKLELLTGANAQTMKLTLSNDAGNFVANLTDPLKTLLDHGVVSGMKIHVVDEASENFFDDRNEVGGFSLSREEYAQKEGTVRDFLTKNKLGKFSEEYKEKLEKDQALAAEKASKMQVGDRCQVSVVKQPIRRGEIMYIGEVHFKPGTWIGVKYDEPMGKNDGSVKDKRYFTCQMNYGGFVSPLDVEVGDIPVELDEDLADLEEM